MASLDTLTDSEIRLKLSEYGYAVGPVTATTRKTLLKKLKSLVSSGPPGGNSGGDAVTKGYDPSCAVTNFSSGEESDEGAVRGVKARRSMPPPRTTTRSPPRRKSPSRLAEPLPIPPLANSTTVDDAPRPASSFEESVVSSSRGSVRHCVGVPDYASYRSSFLSNDFRQSPEEEPARPSYSYTPSSSPSAASRFSLGSGDGFRSRFQSGNSFGVGPLSSASTTPIAQPSSSYQPNQPYSSDLARRLSSLQSSRIGGTSSNLSTKLLDVKESDDEDNGPVQSYTKFGQSGKGSVVMQERSNGRVSQDGWFSCDSPISALLVVFFLLFFLMIGATYINMHSVENGVAPSKSLIYPSCSERGRGVANVECIEDEDFVRVRKIFLIVHDELTERATKMGCYELGNAAHLANRDIVNLAVSKDPTMSTMDVEKRIDSLKVLIKANPGFRLLLTPSDGVALDDAPTSLKCYFVRKLVFAADWLIKLFIMAVVTGVCYHGMKWWMLKNARHKEDVYRLVTNIVEIVSANTQENVNGGYIPISHVRDKLIPPQDRHRLAKLWNDAVTILESDSRLRSEVQLVEGEEFLVWRWLASPISINKRKVWQGQAFETVEGSVNSLPDSPTSCLKIRHMFDPAVEEGEDWVTTVTDAILDKCGDTKILHIVVDRLSREGCVYMKCASQRDAGIAYRALHGSWFDSKLVTVKYIREKRYLERFPDSVKCTLPLQPSNDNKNSLQ